MLGHGEFCAMVVNFSLGAIERRGERSDTQLDGRAAVTVKLEAGEVPGERGRAPTQLGEE